jgi:predicted nucleic acid-binding protein
MITSSKDSISKVIIDADFLIALYIDTDSNHSKAMEIYDRLDDLIVLNLTIYEVATVLSRLLTHSEAKLILINIFADLKEIIIDYDRAWELGILEIYNAQTKKNVSFFDCTCLFLAKKYDYKIASFDKFYPAEILIT